MSSRFGSLNFKGSLFIRFENVFEESSNILLFVDFFLLDKPNKIKNRLLNSNYSTNCMKIFIAIVSTCTLVAIIIPVAILYGGTGKNFYSKLLKWLVWIIPF